VYNVKQLLIFHQVKTVNGYWHRSRLVSRLPGSRFRSQL